MKKTILTVLIISSIFTLSACKSKPEPIVNTPPTTPKEDPLTNLKMQLSNPQDKEEIAVLETSMGTIKIKLFPDVAPETVKNFKELIGQEKYTNVPIHRVISDFMIQMGDFEKGDGTGGYSYKGPKTTIPDEPSSKLKHIYGAVSMAKTSMPNSGGSQFFVVQNKNGTPHLDGVHTVFGQVVDGMKIVEDIAAVKVDQYDEPVKEVLLKSAKIEEYSGK